ncbi:hypothetical protein CROQUDRAFT_650240 [Cronartium quercuum f. sp. fusiforme G11]|uniref:Uncharacterized protein n=1 Tax=Cronartium quercuum f. sp. fusiforme G11 TaxID=708437 RepID=A0A9P6NZ71_9BASI|nr:hypothetical protein CROQUDRAFT_650240 [Cronartium quercuum f. sp. fusiforme G11]
MANNLLDRHQVKDHLNLLKAFSSLKNQVQSNFSFEGLKSSQLDDAAKMLIFVNMAVYRFEHWLEVITTKQLKEVNLVHLPPLDVLMVWHAYCLNPRWYCEDSLRLHPTLQRLSFPLELAATNIKYELNGNVITTSTDSSQERIWSLEMPFDPRINASMSLGRLVICPDCQGNIHTEWTNKEGKGWVDDRLVLACNKCKQWSGTRLDLGMAHFLSDFSHATQEPIAEALVSHTLAGTLTTLHNLVDLGNARLMISHIKKLSGVSQTTLSPINSLLIQNKPKWLSRTLSAYHSGTPFSIDLVGAVIRQSSFINKMVTLRFTEISESLDGQSTLDRCILRYQAFLELMSNDSKMFFVPTLDIDLAWHTHQLSRGAKYCQDTIDIVGRLVDHNDDVDEGHLTDSFSKTAQAWKAKYGVSYSGCNCFLKTEKTTEDSNEEMEDQVITLLDTDPEFSQAIPIKSNTHSLKEVLGSACGGCGGCSGGGECGGGNMSLSMQGHEVSSCGGCGAGGCGSGKCGGGALFSHNGGHQPIGACGGCGSGGCGSGGCGGGLV